MATQDPAPDPIVALVEARQTLTPTHVGELMYSLAQRVRAYDGVTVHLRDSVLHVAPLGGGRTLQVTCARRADDGGRLWLWDSERRPVAPASSPDAPLLVVRRLRERQS